MINHWIAATLIGASLGLALFGCVRARMHFGPRLRARFGDRIRSVYWLVTILIMVALGNGALLGLRTVLADDIIPGYRLLIELWFAVLALGIALALVFRRMRGRRECD